MVLSIKSEHADRLARELAELTGETITQAVVSSLEARLAEERRRSSERGFDDIIERFQLLPVVDGRKPDDIIGYDDSGLPT